jgi:hypothetical protein
LAKYFASYNRITDRTPEILSGMVSLESVILDTCIGVTNTGVIRVTGDVAAAFGAGVRVSWSV